MDIWDCIEDSREENKNNVTASLLLKADEREIEIEHELEVERAYGIPYGKYINRLDTRYFDSDEYRQVFQILTLDRELNESIYKYAKQSILDNWGTNKESMFLIDMDNHKLIASIEHSEDKIDFGIHYTDGFKESLDEAIHKGIRIAAIHNHPHGYPPSLDDISKVIENHYELAIVAGANGLIYKYYNPNKTIFTEDECQDCHQLIAFNVEAGFDIDRAYKDVYDTLGVSYDIIEGGKNL